MSKQKTIPKAKPTVSSSLFEKFESWCSSRNRMLSLLLPALALLFSILMFDAKISIGHDDALYIMAGNNYAKDFFGYYYTDNAPLYVMFLSLPIKIFGVNLLILKFLSIIFFVSSIFFTFKAFSGRVPYVVLVPSMLIFAINWFALTFASLTYTEAFYLMFQGIFFIILFRHIEYLNNPENDKLKEAWGRWLVLGLIMFTLFFSRTVGLGAFMAVAFYFLINRQFKSALLSIVSFGLVAGVVEALKRGLWGDKVSQFSQTNILYLKDAYDPSKGTEDFDGFVNRFIGNTVIYLAGRFWEILGFKDEGTDFSGPLALLTVALLLIGLIAALRHKQKFILSSSLYFFALLAITFIVLQTSWGQTRLVMVFVPLMLMCIFYGFYKFFDKPGTKGFQFFYFVIIGIFLLVNLKTTNAKISKNIPIVKKNLIKGDKFEGYTDDYKNFLKLSEYCADSLPKGSFVVSRKAPMSFVYGHGMEFFPIYKANGPTDADSLYAFLKKQKVTHIMFANLRLNPAVSGDVSSVLSPGMPSIYLAYQDYDKKSIINSIHNYMAPLAQKYPERFELVKVMGDDEESILYLLK